MRVSTRMLIVDVVRAAPAESIVLIATARILGLRKFERKIGQTKREVRKTLRKRS
jgi:hypothetical protein